MAQFNTDLLKKFIAPRIDEPLKVSLPDLSEEFESASTWMQSYFLASIFHGEYTGETRLYVESLLARIQMTFEAYRTGRVKTLEYVERWELGNPGVGRYLAALSEWESVFLNLQIIYDLLSKFFGVTYTQGDREDRARLIANRIKHVSEDIQSGRLQGPGMPMWFTPEGFETITASVTFEELAEQVRFLALAADALSVPAQARERFAALGEKLADDPHYQPRP